MREDIARIRREYEAEGLDAELMSPDPFEEFSDWFSAAVDSGVEQANAFVLATASLGGRPSGRAVLLKDFSENGLTFYTGLDSRKSEELKANPWAAGVFVWMELHRQVRVEGSVKPVDPETADEYFATRPRGAQIAAHASHQGANVADRVELEERFDQFETVYEGESVPRPGHWGGWVIRPDRFEFWQGRPNRFHDRIEYRLDGGAWSRARLAP